MNVKTVFIIDTTDKIKFILYQKGLIQVVVKDETLWATQKAMASLFGVGTPVVSKHLRNIFRRVN